MSLERSCMILHVSTCHHPGMPGLCEMDANHRQQEHSPPQGRGLLLPQHDMILSCSHGPVYVVWKVVVLLKYDMDRGNEKDLVGSHRPPSVKPNIVAFQSYY